VPRQPFIKGALSGNSMMGHRQDEVGGLQRDQLVDFDQQLRSG